MRETSRRTPGCGTARTAALTKEVIVALSIGIDIGGTKIAGGLVNDEGEIVFRARRETPAADANAIIDASVDLIGELQREAGDNDGEVLKVGVACAGYIDKAGTTVLFAPNIAWRDEPLRDRLVERTKLDVVIENDANAAAYGEFLHGGGASAQDMILITLGTGVGGGIVLGGHVLRGSHGIGAEVGHMRVVPGGHRCGCGNRGCWEAYASGTALVREARELVRSTSPYGARLRELCDGDADQLKGNHVTQAAGEGDPAAIELLGDVGRWAGEGMASLAAIIDPELFVIGGGVADAGDLVLKPAVQAFDSQLTGRGHRPSPKITLATLGNDAGVIGAASLAREGRA